MQRNGIIAGSAALSCVECTNMYVGQGVSSLGGVPLPPPLPQSSWVTTGFPLGSQGQIVSGVSVGRAHVITDVTCSRHMTTTAALEAGTVPAAPPGAQW